MKQEKLLQMIKSGVIKIKFDQSDNLTKENLEAIIQAVQDKNNTLQTLILNDSNIGDEGAKAIAKALQHNRSLKTLSLKDNGIGAAGAQALAKTLYYNNTLQTLILDDNNMGDDGAEAIAAALKHNQSLKSLDLGLSGIHIGGAIKLAEALQSNTTLTTLDLSNNHYLFNVANDPPYLTSNIFRDIGGQEMRDELQEATKEAKEAIEAKLETNRLLQRQYRTAAPAATLALNQGLWKKNHVMDGAARLPYLPSYVVTHIVEMAKPKPGDIPRPETLSEIVHSCCIQ